MTSSAALPSSFTLTPLLDRTTVEIEGNLEMGNRQQLKQLLVHRLRRPRRAGLDREARQGWRRHDPAHEPERGPADAVRADAARHAVRARRARAMTMRHRLHL